MTWVTGQKDGYIYAHKEYYINGGLITITWQKKVKK